MDTMGQTCQRAAASLGSLDVVLIEDRQVVVGVCLTEWMRVCVCCKHMRFQTNSKPMHASKTISSKPNKQIKNSVAYSLQLPFLFKTQELIRRGSERLKTISVGVSCVCLATCVRLFKGGILYHQVWVWLAITSATSDITGGSVA